MIYIVLQLFYTLSHCTGRITDRFAIYEKNQFCNPFALLSYSSHHTTAWF